MVDTGEGPAPVAAPHRRTLADHHAPDHCAPNHYAPDHCAPNHDAHDHDAPVSGAHTAEVLAELGLPPIMAHHWRAGVGAWAGP
jgi:hypothetical protein